MWNSSWLMISLHFLSSLPLPAINSPGLIPAGRGSTITETIFRSFVDPAGSIPVNAFEPHAKKFFNGAAS